MGLNIGKLWPFGLQKAQTVVSRQESCNKQFAKVPKLNCS